MQMKCFVLACLFASSALTAHATSEDDAWMLLQKAAVAARALNYQGVFVYQAGRQTKSVQITHYFNGKNEFARNVILDGTPREVFSQGGDLTILSPRNEKVVIEKRRGQNMFPAILPTNLDAVKESYVLKVDQIERVAGRPTQLLHLIPKDGLRYSYRFWIDVEFGLLLKSVMLNPQREVMESIGFNQISLLNTVDLDWFQPKIDAKKNYVMEDEGDKTIADNAANANWIIKDLPAGYRKVDQMKRMVHGRLQPITHVVFSDGLASVSLFIEPLIKGARPKSGHKLVGTTSFYANVVDGYQIIVVGEVPEATVAQIANAISFKK
jgi:sigma-E factor negative regulatory protein RseB